MMERTLSGGSQALLLEGAGCRSRLCHASHSHWGQWVWYGMPMLLLVDAAAMDAGS